MNPCVPHTVASRTLDPRQPELPRLLQALLRPSGCFSLQFQVEGGVACSEPGLSDHPRQDQGPWLPSSCSHGVCEVSMLAKSPDQEGKPSLKM